MRHQGMDESAFALLQADGDWPAAEAGAQLSHPRGNGFGLLRQSGMFGFIAGAIRETDGVFLVGPIDADEGREGLGRW